MDELLELLKANAQASPSDIAKSLGISEADAKKKIAEYEESGVIRGYQAILNEDSLGLDTVSAVIEVKLTPERGGGFNKISNRISKFPEVESMYLMSGAYDVLVFVSGDGLKEVASFVSEKLATIEGVISTATHFRLKTYKERGVMMEIQDEQQRLKVSP